MTGCERRSLSDLPLDIIMEILFYLPFQDLENVAKTCKTLRVLSNESITYHRTFKATSPASQWTKQILFDFLHIIDQKQQFLNFIDSEQISVVNAAHDLQKRFNLGTYPRLLTQQDSDGPSSSESHQEDSPDTTTRESGLKSAFAVTGRTRSTASPDREGLAYLKILQGFQRIATNSHKLFESKHSNIRNQSSGPGFGQTAERPQTPSKAADAEEPPTSQDPSSLHALSPKEETDITLTENSSPGSSHHSSSTSSLFSEVPKLSDLTWSYSDVFKSVEPQNTDSDGESSDSTSSTKYLRELQRSTKVSDKKYLFERLHTRIQLAQESTHSKTEDGDGDTTWKARPAPKTAQSFSQGYVVELERCNSPSLPPQLEASKSSQEFLTRYQDHIATGINSTHEATRKKHKPRRQSQAPHRRTLIATITKDNRICYEKL
ncbi:LAME_0D08944g1_1 [Lachancea meyersii CBS 8951]|uniref:LAME_0D08944g1_1 n=1 Tax=Lachancea meyersii CBS 8951 TaxID=1266667 RepID=A0A1G4JAT0_9SACH|nr:LAME_0D08944g1_1 [Lachancea meyersii CBS 8951]